MYKAVHGKAPSGDDWKMLKHLFNMGVMVSKGIMLPKNTPDDVLAAWISAAKMAVKDPELLKLAKRDMGGYPHSFGADADKIKVEAVGVTPESKAWMRNWIDNNLKKRS